MKKVVFLQNEGNVLGGVWFVNKTIGEELLKNNYDVSIISIRNGINKTKLNYDNKINFRIINNKIPWSVTKGTEIKESLNKHNFIKAVKLFFKRYYEKILLYIDNCSCKKELKKINPDYIIASQYEVLDAIPNSLLKKTVYQQHSSFNYVLSQQKNYNYLFKYNNKIKFLWLSKASMKSAELEGLNNNYYIYNPSRISSDTKADVINNKKLITISRIVREQKRIDLMIQIIEKLFKNKKYKDWIFEIYGNGEDIEELKKMITNQKQIVFKGETKDPQTVLLKSSINLNTSSSEGYSMSIIEACSCGIPTVSFNYGESVYEQISNEKNGYIIENDNIEEYLNKLMSLMDNSKKLIEFSNESYNCYLEKNEIKKVIKEWIKLFKEIDME